MPQKPSKTSRHITMATMSREMNFSQKLSRWHYGVVLWAVREALASLLWADDMVAYEARVRSSLLFFEMWFLQDLRPPRSTPKSTVFTSHCGTEQLYPLRPLSKAFL